LINLALTITKNLLMELERTNILDEDGEFLYEEIHYDDDHLIKKELESIKEKINVREVDINKIKEELKDKRRSEITEIAFDYVDWLNEYTRDNALYLGERVLTIPIEEFIYFLNDFSG
jgi:hypothetical protein